MKRPIVRGLFALLALSVPLCGTFPSSQAVVTACVWASAKAAGGTTSTVKVDSDGEACPATLPPPNPEDPCTTPVEAYRNVGPDGAANVKVLVCARTP